MKKTVLIEKKETVIIKKNEIDKYFVINNLFFKEIPPRLFGLEILCNDCLIISEMVDLRGGVIYERPLSSLHTLIFKSGDEIKLKIKDLDLKSFQLKIRFEISLFY